MGFLFIFLGGDPFKNVISWDNDPEREGSERDEKDIEWERGTKKRRNGTDELQKVKERERDKEEECMRSVGKRRNETGEAFSKKAESEKKADEYDYLMASSFFCF